MKLNVRKIKAIDIGVLYKMVTDFLKESDLPYPKFDEEEVEKQMLHVLTNINNSIYIYLIAHDGKKPAGYFLGYMGDHEYGKPSRVGVAQEMYVVPNKRGGQVAMGLMRTAYRAAVENGAEAIECIGSYGKTDKMWAKFGFELHLSYGHLSLDDAKKRFDRGEKE